MTTKDYWLIANAINGLWQSGSKVEKNILGRLVLRLEVALENQNPLFDHGKFRAACFREDATDGE